MNASLLVDPFHSVFIQRNLQFLYFCCNTKRSLSKLNYLSWWDSSISKIRGSKLGQCTPRDAKQSPFLNYCDVFY
jgi:hypothetical protein